MLRVSYKTKMKVWQDGDGATVPVRWFRAPAGAKLAPQPTVFGSHKSFNPELDNTGQIGEQTGEFLYDKGANPVGYTGKQRCGPDDAYRTGGARGKHPPIQTDERGFAACCGANTIEICTFSIPKILFCRPKPVVGCACCGDTVIRLEHRTDPFTWAGKVFTNWWGPPGPPPQDVGGPQSYPQFAQLPRLGACRWWAPYSQSGPTYCWVFFSIMSPECQMWGGWGMLFGALADPTSVTLSSRNWHPTEKTGAPTFPRATAAVHTSPGTECTEVGNGDFTFEFDTK